MTEFTTGSWIVESVEAAAHAICDARFTVEWDDLESEEQAWCRRTASRALGAAIVAVQVNDIERAERGRPVRLGFVTVA